MTPTDLRSPARVTVITPCFNDDPFHIAAAVSSVRSQTYADLELIIVDDGSTDERTLAALRQLESTGITVIHTPNRGPAAARNTGISHSTGEYILPLDADDILSPGAVESLVNTLSSTPAVVAYPQVEYFGGPHTSSLPRPQHTVIDLLARNQIPVTALYRHTTWAELGGYDEQLRLGHEDWEWWVRILLRGGVARLAVGAHLSIRVRSDSRSRSSSRAHDADAITREHIARNSASHPTLLPSILWERIYSLESELAPLQKRFGPLQRVLTRAPWAGFLYDSLMRFYGKLRSTVNSNRIAARKAQSLADQILTHETPASRRPDSPE